MIMASKSSSDKRKKQWMGGRDGHTKRHKGTLAATANAKGHGAVLVTCDKIKRDKVSVMRSIF